MFNKVSKKELLVLHNLVLHKIKLQFSDQILGYSWAVLNPLTYLFSFWFFAYVGIRSGIVQGIPFVVWVMPGLLAYRFVTTVFSHSATILTGNGMLIKETRVDVRLVPLIEAMKECYIHFAVMLIMFVIFTVIGRSAGCGWDYLPNIYYLNFIYYWFTAIVFVVVLAYLFSGIGLLFRDTKNIINALMVPIFWMTPVLFSVENGLQPVVEKAEKLFNPFYYFIHGYRNTMLYHTFFFENTWYNVYIWVIIIIFALIARRIWKFILPIISDLI